MYLTIIQKLDVCYAIGTNQCLCLPKVEMNTKFNYIRWCSQRGEMCKHHSYNLTTQFLNNQPLIPQGG